jgi:hypothetical protein
MPQTNATVDISVRSRDWKNDETITLVGTYKVWLDEHSSTVIRNVVGQRSSQIQLDISRGVVIMFIDIDLTDSIVNINGYDYEIITWDRFLDRKGNFHHLEFIYR